MIFKRRLMLITSVVYLLITVLGCDIANKEEIPSGTNSESYNISILSAVEEPTESESITLINNSQSEINLKDWILGDKNNPNALTLADHTLAPGETITYNHNQLNFDIDDYDETIYLMDNNRTLISRWNGGNVPEAEVDPETLGIPLITVPEAYYTKTFYSLQYNELYEQADWVAYELTSEEVNGLTDRKDTFKEDPDVLTGSASLADYSGSGFDRGHMAPAADMKMSDLSMSESFYMSNMSPQTAGFNRGIWAKLEGQVRTWVLEYESLYVVTGIIVEEGYETIGANKVAIPQFYYKALLDYTGGEVKTIGFILPHESSSLDLSEFAVTIDSLENITGLDFFHGLPDIEEVTLEAGINTALWF